LRLYNILPKANFYVLVDVHFCNNYHDTTRHDMTVIFVNNLGFVNSQVKVLISLDTYTEIRKFSRFFGYSYWMFLVSLCIYVGKSDNYIIWSKIWSFHSGENSSALMMKAVHSRRVTRRRWRRRLQYKK
jgi:hypothetical protein